MKWIVIVSLATLLLTGCGQLNREYTIRVFSEESAGDVTVNVHLNGLEVMAEDANKLDNTPEVTPEIDIIPGI